MNGLPYYKAYPRDFIEGTVGMQFELKAGYRLVLDLIYMQGGNLPDDPRYISGLLGCSIRKWKSIRNELVRIGKLEVSGEFLTNKRAVSELESLSKLQRNNSENRSRPNKNNGLQSRSFNHTEPEPEPEPIKRKEETTVSSKKRGKRIPDDWQPDLVFANREGVDHSRLLREADKFRDYWKAQPGAKGVKLDWDATWRNWIRKVADESKGQAAKTDWRQQPEYRGVL